MIQHRCALNQMYVFPSKQSHKTPYTGKKFRFITSHNQAFSDNGL